MGCGRKIRENEREREWWKAYYQQPAEVNWQEFSSRSKAIRIST
jgi:hypothetical protein